MKKLDLTNQQFGRLTVIRETTPYIWQGKPKIQWICHCKCGNFTTVTTEHLRSNHTTSCGCYGREQVNAAVTKHGEARIKKRSIEYNRWSGIIKRCYDKHATNYKYYGGRGVTICDRWRNSFQNFLHDMGRCPKGFELDRINNNLGYMPENCRWVSARTNRRNMRTNRLITINGETKLVIEWCEHYNLNPQMVYQRIHRKWPEHRWFEPPK